MAEDVGPLEYNSEDRVRQRNMAITEFIVKKDLEPPAWLENMETIFKWVRSLRIVLTIAWNIPDKLRDYKNQGAFYGFEKFVFLLVIIYNKTDVKLYVNDSSEEEDGSDESDNKSTTGEEKDDEDEYELEKAYAQCQATLDEMAAHEGDTMYSRIGPAFQHVLQATRAHMLFLDGNIAESQELAKNIQPVENMSQECKAGFEGMKAKFVLSMYQDYRIVLSNLFKAMELDPQFGYWPYLTGKVIRRLRREFKEKMVKEELQYFEKAVELERNPKFLVFLAQAYQEMAQVLFFTRDPSLLGTMHEMLQKSVELYRECWTLKNDSASISRRVGNGMMKMKAEFMDKTVTKEALLKAVELSANNVTHCALGKFYYIHEKDDEKALEHFNMVYPGNFGATEIIRLNLIRDPNYDPDDLVQSWVKANEATVKKYISFGDAAWYYLVYKRNLELSVKYIWKQLKKDYKSFRVMEYQSYAFCVEGPINMIEVLVNEILLLKEKNESLPLEDKKDLTFFEHFLEKIFDKHPDLRNITPKHNLVEELRQNVERCIGYKRRKRYGSLHNRRSEARYTVEEAGSWRNHDGLQESNNREPWQRELETDGNRRLNQHSANRENINIRSEMYNSYRSRNREDASSSGQDRSNSGSRFNWGRTSSDRTSNSRDETTTQNERSRRFSSGSGGRMEREDTRRQYRSFNNNRYDVTITDWRSENRRQ